MAILPVCMILGCNLKTDSKSFLEVSKLDGGVAKVGKNELVALKRSIKGELLTSKDSSYSTAVEIWNRKRHPLNPALLVKCSNEEDVVKTLKFVESKGLLLSIKGGGHNSAGFSLNDNGVVLDLSLMDGIEVNPETKTAIAGPGVRWGKLDEATQRFGLATTGAIISDVGIGGYTLGGGLGWLHRSLGSASDNLVSARIVIANGDVLEVDAENNSDLYWAIRGGGGNFGVVTSFTYRLHDVGPKLVAGLVFYSMDDVDSVIDFYRDYIKDIPDDLGTWLLFRKAPISSALPKDIHGKPVVAISITYNGSLEDGQKYTAPLRNIVEPLADLVKPRLYTEWQSSLDGAWGNGYHNIWKGHYFMEITDSMIAVLKDKVALGSPFSDIKIQHLGGKFAEMPEAATAFGNRNANFGLVIQTRWLDDANTEYQEQWTDDVFNELKRYTTGNVYVNFMDNEGEKRVRDAYPKKTMERLGKIKSKYDPGNLFRKNQNIKPKE